MGYVNDEELFRSAKALSKNDFHDQDRMSQIDNEQEPLIKFFQGISFRIEISFPEPGVVRYIAYPELGSYDAGMRLTLDVEYIEDEKPADDDVDEYTLEFFHQQILDKLFEMADSVRQQKIQDWVGLDNTSSSN